MKRFVRSGRAELCVEDSQTAGPAIVCLHAGVCDRRIWARQVEALQATHRVIVYDRRGFGETRCEPEPFSHLDARMRELARRIPRAQNFVMDGVANLPGLEQPARFNTAVGRFLAALPERGG